MDYLAGYCSIWQAVQHDKYTNEIIHKIKNPNIHAYSLRDSNAFVYGKNLTNNDMGYYSFDLCIKGQISGRINLSVPGLFNLYNALAAIATATHINVPFEIIKLALENFSGTDRRFEFKGRKNNITVIDDYAHHPSEIKSTLGVFKPSTQRTLWCVFQSHTYTRTKLFLDDFAISFQNADKIIIADIYAAREIDTGEVSGKILADKIKETGKDAKYISGFENINSYLLENTKSGDLILTMGAGDINKVGDMFLNG